MKRQCEEVAYLVCSRNGRCTAVAAIVVYSSGMMGCSTFHSTGPSDGGRRADGTAGGAGGILSRRTVEKLKEERIALLVRPHRMLFFFFSFAVEIHGVVGVGWISQCKVGVARINHPVELGSGDARRPSKRVFVDKRRKGSGRKWGGRAGSCALELVGGVLAMCGGGDWGGGIHSDIARGRLSDVFASNR